MNETDALLQRYLKAREEKDLDAMVSCWHPDVEIEHPMRPDRNWRGLDTYRRQWALIWERAPQSHFDVVSSAVVGDRIYLETRTEMSDGTMIPSMSVWQVQDGKIYRGRVYTDQPRRDGVNIDGYADEINPLSR